jgi:hypothetical protein
MSNLVVNIESPLAGALFTGTPLPNICSLRQLFEKRNNP